MIILFRRANVSDLNKLKTLQQKLVIYERPFDSEIPKKGKVEYYNIKKLIKDKNARMIVAEINSNIVGCGFGQIRKNDIWCENKKFGYVGLLYVDKNFRGQKIGKSIINELVKWFKNNKISDIRLKVYDKNANAVEAYKKYGFETLILEMKYKN